ncbi:hypothetical protein BpHYR1_016889 [Brachionus plicatilis]|uniref:Uncharacterized protein n=1 Tax=Brachionus plicatilis TaxID=10195 RepID=A0A3M7RG58_BRAPC|nr:hypothetical protein BpHYR1_016889 [Brachionus plicatilis]
MKGLQTLEPTLASLVVQRPADVLEKCVVQKFVRTLAHPLANFVDADGANVGAHVPVPVYEHGLEYEVDKVLDFLFVFGELVFFLHKQFDAVLGTLRLRLLLFVGVLALIGVLGDAEREQRVDQSGHYFEDGEGGRVTKGADLRVGQRYQKCD